MTRRPLTRAVLAAAVLLLAGCDPGAGPVPATAGQGTAPERSDAAEPDVVPGLPPLHPAIDHLDETTVTVTTATGSVEVRAKVATRDEDLRRGLMEVEELPDGTGMLFLFEQDRTGGFWMFNTLVPLDILFAAADGTVVTVATMTPCGSEDAADCPVTTPDAPYRTALEVPAGWAAAVGAEVGDHLWWEEPRPVPTATPGGRV